MSRFTPQVRLAIYSVLSALVPVLVSLGVFTDTDASMWLGLAGAILGVGGSLMAAANTPRATAGWVVDDDYPTSTNSWPSLGRHQED